MSRQDAIRLEVVIKPPTPALKPGDNGYGKDFYFKKGRYWRSDGEEACNNHDGDWYCTLPQEHGGPHIAEDGGSEDEEPPTWES